MLMTFGGDSLSQISDSDVISLMTSFAKNGCVTFDTTTLRGTTFLMEQHTFKNVNNHQNINIYSYLETSGGQSSNLYLNVVNFFNTSANQTSVAA